MLKFGQQFRQNGWFAFYKNNLLIINYLSSIQQLFLKKACKAVDINRFLKKVTARKSVNTLLANFQSPTKQGYV